MEQLGRDIRIGLRFLLKRPGTSALAAIALALGIGLTTTMFCIVDGVFLRGLPFERAHRLFYLGEQDARLADKRPRATPMNDYIAWRAAQHSFEDLAAFVDIGADVAADGVTPKRYETARITANTFSALRVAPIAGRALTDADAAEGAAPVALISETAWKRQFGGDPAIVGRLIRVNREPVTVVGVMAAGFGFPHNHDVWLPLSVRETATRKQGRLVEVFGRLREGVGPAMAQTELHALAERVAHREAVSNLAAYAIPLMDRFIARQVTTTLTIMLGAVFGVLLIACVNVTNLLLTRAADRAREVGIRLAIGSSRGRVIRQLLLEGVILSAAGAAAGIGIAYAGVAFFNATMADSTPPFWIDVRVDARVLLFTAGLTIASALASSLAPALRASRIGILGVLKETARSTTGLRMVRFSRALVVAEIAVSFALLIASGLLIKSVLAATRVEIPFRTDLFHARVMFPDRPYRDRDSVAQATARLIDLVAAEPGISGAAVTTALPDNAGSDPVAIDAASAALDAEHRPRARRLAVSPEFFGVMGIRALQGRLFDAHDRQDQQPIAIVTEDFARRFFSAGTALGRRIQVGAEADQPWRTIVGVVPRLVVANVTTPSTTSEAVLLPIAQVRPSRWLALLVATTGDPSQAGKAVQQAVARLDPDLPLDNVTTLAQMYHDQSWPIRMFGTIFASFGVSALLLAAAGLFGVMSFGVRSRTQELGVRMALGAKPAAILWMVLRQGATLLAIGMAVGFGAGGVLSQQLGLFLFAVKPWDPGVMTTVALVLAAAGVTATLVPAARAAALDPVVALRDE